MAPSLCGAPGRTGERSAHACAALSTAPCSGLPSLAPVSWPCRRWKNRVPTLPCCCRSDEIDLTPALGRLDRLADAAELALDPQDLSRGPDPARAPVSLEDLTFVVVRHNTPARDDPLPDFDVGPVRIGWSIDVNGKQHSGFLD